MDNTMVELTLIEVIGEFLTFEHDGINSCSRDIVYGKYGTMPYEESWEEYDYNVDEVIAYASQYLNKYVPSCYASFQERSYCDGYSGYGLRLLTVTLY